MVSKPRFPELLNQTQALFYHSERLFLRQLLALSGFCSYIEKTWELLCDKRIPCSWVINEKTSRWRAERELSYCSFIWAPPCTVAASQAWWRPRVLKFLEKNHHTSEEQRSVCAVGVPGDGTVTLFGDRAWREQLGGPRVLTCLCAADTAGRYTAWGASH